LNNSLKEKFGISSEKKVILVLTQWFVEAGVWSKKDREYFIYEIAKACVNLTDVQLIIKLHPPYENEADYREIYIIDGNASRRISDLIREMVHNHREVYSIIHSKLKK
jgi:hypothetical protein